MKRNIRDVINKNKITTYKDYEEYRSNSSIRLRFYEYIK